MKELDWFKELLDEVARANGFSSMEEYQIALSKHIYGNKKYRGAKMKHYQTNNNRTTANTNIEERINISKIDELKDPERKSKQIITKDDEINIIIDLYLFGKKNASITD